MVATERETGNPLVKIAPNRNLRDELPENSGAVAPPKPKFLPTGLSRAIVLGSVIISVALAAALPFSARYDLIPAPNSVNGFMYRIDRLTGAVQFCGPQGCSPLPCAAD